MKLLLKNDQGKVLFENNHAGDVNDQAIMRLVEAAVQRGRDLRFVQLSKANLYFVDLEGAKFAFADLRGANLRYTDLSKADLEHAKLRNADLSCSNIETTCFAGDDVIDAGMDRRSYRFIAIRHDATPMIKAGCRWYTLAEATAHWLARHATDRALAHECLAKVDMIRTVAMARGWTIPEDAYEPRGQTEAAD